MLIAQFIEYLGSEKNYAAHTITAYKKDLEDFDGFLRKENTILQKANKKNVKNYIAHLIQQRLAERSINRKISTLQSFYKFLLLTETIENIPTKGIKTLKHYHKPQIPYSEKEMGALLGKDLFDQTFAGIRNQLIIEMLYHTGMRKAELIALHPNNVDVEKKEIKVLGKRNKERIIPIHENLIEMIQKYKEAVKVHDLQLNETFFIKEDNKSLYPKLVYNVVNSYLSLVTEKNKKSPHMLRHSFATHILQNGAEINAVKEILGHSSLAATQVYTHSDIEQLKKVFNNSHPRENKN